MTTSELIKRARNCRAIDICGDCSCPYFETTGNCGNELLKDLADRLEGAYIDLQVTEDCQICMNAPECHYEYTKVCKGWQWRGDME